jgi:hypothetical protein
MDNVIHIAICYGIMPGYINGINGYHQQLEGIKARVPIEIFVTTLDQYNEFHRILDWDSDKPEGKYERQYQAHRYLKTNCKRLEMLDSYLFDYD